MHIYKSKATSSNRSIVYNVHGFSEDQCIVIIINSIMRFYCIVIDFICLFNYINASWDQWWAYDGISGPNYWGLINPKWSHCNKGRKQSPIDINPDLLLYDPGLEPIELDGSSIKGSLINTGRGLKLETINASLTITSGPLSYIYSINHLIFHYGREDDRGSEHTINGISFAGELQLYFYNSQLYSNWNQASHESNGLVVIAVLIQIITDANHPSNVQLENIFKATEDIKSKGARYTIEDINISELLPTLEHYITYEGSLTEPPCFETVQWIVLNKPIYATEHQLSFLRNSINIDGYGDNYRPIQSTNYRCIRTNILKEHNSTMTDSDTMKTRYCGNKGYISYKANVKKDDN